MSVTTKNVLVYLRYPSVPHVFPIPIPRQSLVCFLSLHIIFHFLEYNTNKINFFSTFIYFWHRERQSMNRGGAEREGDTESETGSRL